MPLNSRRTSSTPFTSAQDASHQAPDSETSVPQAMSTSMYEQSTESRYSREQLLAVFKAQQESGPGSRDVSHLYVNNWNPENTNGANGRSGWGRPSDTRETHGPEVCWDASGNILPIALEEMDEAERKVGYTKLLVLTYRMLIVQSSSLPMSIRPSSLHLRTKVRTQIHKVEPMAAKRQSPTDKARTHSRYLRLCQAGLAHVASSQVTLLPVYLLQVVLVAFPGMRLHFSAVSSTNRRRPPTSVAKILRVTYHSVD